MESIGQVIRELQMAKRKTADGISLIQEKGMLRWRNLIHPRNLAHDYSSHQDIFPYNEGKLEFELDA